MIDSARRTLALVIDDATDVLAGTYQVLEARGYQVATRRTVLEGCHYAQSAKPHLVLVGDAFWCMDVVDTLRRFSPRSHVLRLSNPPVEQVALEASRSSL